MGFKEVNPYGCLKFKFTKGHVAKIISYDDHSTCLKPFTVCDHAIGRSGGCTRPDPSVVVVLTNANVRSIVEGRLNLIRTKDNGFKEGNGDVVIANSVFTQCRSIFNRLR